ncbi:unnamed protein product [Prorocentrum cordatum]|uniref:Poly(A) RNA polymerase mitochondrial-like central palm domain-containing protein n=1 Tax=Prorocentrum cordatum TaxID=2364126 RepID=A0ABN9T1H3_9DINO|nr:unnamed protein product [Polarella glacialis]
MGVRRARRARGATAELAARLRARAEDGRPGKRARSPIKAFRRVGARVNGDAMVHVLNSLGNIEETMSTNNVMLEMRASIASNQTQISNLGHSIGKTENDTANRYDNARPLAAVAPDPAAAAFQRGSIGRKGVPGQIGTVCGIGCFVVWRKDQKETDLTVRMGAPTEVRQVNRIFGALWAGALLASVLPEPERLAAVETCLGQIQLLVLRLFGEEASLVVQGSYAQGLALRSSDLDVAIVEGAGPAQAGRRVGRGRDDPGEAERMAKKRALSVLQRLAGTLSELGSPEVRVANRIFSARVPVLRLHCRAGAQDRKPGHGAARLVVDVSVGGSLARGACDRCIHALLRQDKVGVAPALCRAIKLWAKRRRLTDTLRGGLSSFGFVLLGVFFLQRPPLGQSGRRPAAAPRLPPHDAIADRADAAACEGCPDQFGGHAAGTWPELAMHLSGFFDWAQEMLPKYCDRELSVTTAKLEPRARGKGGRMCRKPLMIQVPFSPADNAARCLRAAVWEGTLLPELARAARLAHRAVAAGGGRSSAAAVRALFAPAGAPGDEPAAGPRDPSPPDTGPGEPQESSGVPLAKGGCARLAGRGAADGAGPQKKRRRISAMREAYPVVFEEERDPVAAALEASSCPSQPHGAAPVQPRWQSLRSLLRP